MDNNNGIKCETPAYDRVKVSVFRICAIVIMLAASVAWIAALILNYDPEPGYFESGKFLPTVAVALVCIGGALGLATLIFIPKNTLPKTPGSNTNKVYFASVYAAFIMLADAGYRFYNGFIQSGSSDSPLIGSDINSGIISAMTFVCILSSLGSACAFFVRSSGRRSWKGMGAIGLFPVIRAICGLALPYFDMSVPMNSPVKVLSEFSMMALMLYYLAEDRFDLSKNRVKPNLWFAIAISSVVICGTCGISGIFAYFSGAEDNGELLIEAFFSITSLFYILTRIDAYFSPDAEAPEAEGDGEPAGDAASADAGTAADVTVEAQPENSDTADENTKAE